MDHSLYHKRNTKTCQKLMNSGPFLIQGDFFPVQTIASKSQVSCIEIGGSVANTSRHGRARRTRGGRTGGALRRDLGAYKADESKRSLLSSPSELRSLLPLSCSRPCVFSPPTHKDDEVCVWMSVCAGSGVCKSGKPTGAAV